MPSKNKTERAELTTPHVDVDLAAHGYRALSEAGHLAEGGAGTVKVIRKRSIG